MGRTRCWRRAQRERAIERTYRWMKDRGLDAEERQVRRAAVTPHPCSGFCCGNPRRWFNEPTMQERRIEE